MWEKVIHNLFKRVAVILSLLALPNLPMAQEIVRPDALQETDVKPILLKRKGFAIQAKKDAQGRTAQLLLNGSNTWAISYDKNGSVLIVAPNSLQIKVRPLTGVDGKSTPFANWEIIGKADLNSPAQPLTPTNGLTSSFDEDDPDPQFPCLADQCGGEGDSGDTTSNYDPNKVAACFQACQAVAGGWAAACWRAGPYFPECIAAAEAYLVICQIACFN